MIKKIVFENLIDWIINYVLIGGNVFINDKIKLIMN